MNPVRQSHHFLKFIFALSLLQVLSVAAPQHSISATLTPLEQEGKEIYRKGISSSGPLSAFVGKSSRKISATFFPCVNCHGLDGRGRPEGTLEPPAITWEELTKPYGHIHKGERTHDPFDTQNLIRAVTAGIDPSGNRLHPGMPRYELSPEDSQALVAYLKAIEHDDDPGVTDNTLRLGILLPGEPSKVNPLHSLIRGFFNEMNNRGGVFGRQIQPIFSKPFDNVTSYTEAVRHLVEEEDIFALFGASMAEADKDVFRILKPVGVPLITPTIWTEYSQVQRKHLRFRLFPGLAEQTRALVTYAHKVIGPAPKSAVVMPPEGEIFAQIWNAFEDEIKQSGWPDFISIQYSGIPGEAERIAKRLDESNVEALFFFGPVGKLGTLLTQAEKMKWKGRVFAPMRSVSREAFRLPKPFSNRIFLANPTLPSNFDPKSLKEFQRILAKYKVPKFYQVQALYYFATAKILIDGLQRSGRSLKRQRLIQALEGMNEFDTGLTPKVSFGPNRRTGSLGSYIITLDLDKGNVQPKPTWIKLD